MVATTNSDAPKNEASRGHPTVNRLAIASAQPQHQPPPSDLISGFEPSFEVPLVARTPPRDTTKLVELLEPLTEDGMTLQEVLIEGMGRFPVAGIAHYSDDWLNPRYTPTFHLHQGLDIFAARGTPIRAPDEGIVESFSNNPASGGVAISMRGREGYGYYFAHLSSRAQGLRVGQRVKKGTVIGYVGDTGNARGGDPHLHLEIHQSGPIPPKPFVDRWLDEAEAAAPGWVEARRGELHAEEPLDEKAAGPTMGYEDTPMVVPSSSTASADEHPADATERWSLAATEAPIHSPGQLLVAIGTLLLVWALVWKVMSAMLANRRLKKALSDTDPVRRASAVSVATAQGLARHAGTLARLVEREESNEVLEAVADAVGRNLWEPGDTAHLVDLRLWADERRRHSGPGALNGHQRRRRESLGDVRLIVTGAGGPAGVSVVRALAARCHVIAVDSDPLAAGLHLAQESEVVPKADDASFVTRLLDVAGRTGANAIIVTLTEEMLVLSRRRDEVEKSLATWFPSRASLEMCQDKWRFTCAMREAGIAVPPTALGSAANVPGPWVVKPRCARGSRDVYLVDHADEVASVAAKVRDPIVQTRVMGREFTVDALVSRDGELVGAVPRWRLETKAGISTKGRTFADDRVLEGVAAVLSVLHLQGPANVQGFVDGSNVYFIEVNPRFSGGLPLSLAAGADLVGEYVRGILGLPLRSERLAYREGTTMTRHFEEIYT